MLALTALADPTRLHIVELLAAQGELSVGQINQHFSISPPAISQHLKVLKDSNLVFAVVKAQQRIYDLNPEGIAEIESWLSTIKRLWMDRVEPLDQLLEDIITQLEEEI